jgi:adenosylhomocysteine nucleosidase
MNGVTGIMGAMPEEIEGLLTIMDDIKKSELGRRKFYSGKINGKPVVVVYSRWGKVAAATTVSALIHEFRINSLVFTGVAGALDTSLQIGDIVLAKRTLQHDMNGSPLFARYEIPQLNRSWFDTDEAMNENAERSIKAILESSRLHKEFSNEQLERFGMKAPSFHKGDVISGDQFIAGNAHKQQLVNNHPTVLCVEMEGAAVGQVCYEHGIPYSLIRTISDTADDHSPVDFTSFIREIASQYSVEIIREMFSK